MSAVRGTLLAASREQLRSAGRFDAYARALSPAARVALDEHLSFAWIDLGLAHEHYRALDTLALDEACIVHMTRATGERVNRVFLTTALRLLRATGISPRGSLPAFSKLWHRLYRGGALAVRGGSANDARVLVMGQPLTRWRYYRIGVRAQCELFLSYCAKSPAVRELRHDETASTLTLVARWA